MTGGMTGGHFIGFYLALFGIFAIAFALTRPSFVRRLGSKQLHFVAGSIAACLLLALFGSGNRETHFQLALGPQDGVVSRLDQTRVDEALTEILRPGFVEYLGRLDAGAAVSEPERINKALSVRVGTTVDLLAEGYHFDIPPKVGQTWLLVSYKDQENAVFGLIKGEAGVRRLVVSERLVSRVLPQAAAIMALRAAKTDAEKIAILKENPFVTPYAAEWLVVEFEKLIKDASPEVGRELTQKKAFVQKYVDSPEARELPVGTRVEAP